MSKLHWKRIIDDIQSQGIQETLQEELLDTFERMMARTATTLANKAWIDLADANNAEARGIAGFKLTLTRTCREKDRDVWTGIFENGNQRMEVIGSLENR
ncbi:hypothetical protein [Magnetococcus sp. PR-3]|uniref:hypothetical protein n=1 Tax=Magnetococcus sp. PR-3 TaxID=3120355 RepID=UPI002FCE1E25